MCTLNTKVAYSTAFHPQMDGMAEVSNRTLGQLLCLHCKDNRWVNDLPLLSLLYNATPQSQTQKSPYFVATGCQPCLPIDLVLSDLKVPAVRNFLDQITSLWRAVKAKLMGQSQHDNTAADHA